MEEDKLAEMLLTSGRGPRRRRRFLLTLPQVPPVWSWIAKPASELDERKPPHGNRHQPFDRDRRPLRLPARRGDREVHWRGEGDLRQDGEKESSRGSTLSK